MTRADDVGRLLERARRGIALRIEAQARRVNDFPGWVVPLGEAAEPKDLLDVFGNVVEGPEPLHGVALLHFSDLAEPGLVCVEPAVLDAFRLAVGATVRPGALQGFVDAVAEAIRVELELDRRIDSSLRPPHPVAWSAREKARTVGVVTLGVQTDTAFVGCLRLLIPASLLPSASEELAGRTDAELIVEVARLRMTRSQLADLEVGATLELGLPLETPLSLRVSSAEVAQGTLGVTSQGRPAVHVSGTGAARPVE